MKIVQSRFNGSLAKLLVAPNMTVMFTIVQVFSHHSNGTCFQVSVTLKHSQLFHSCSAGREETAGSAVSTRVAISQLLK